MFSALIKNVFGGISPFGYVKWILIAVLTAVVLGTVTYFVRDYYVTKGLVQTQAEVIKNKDKIIADQNKEIEKLAQVNNQNKEELDRLRKSNDATLAILAEKSKSVADLYKKDKANTAKLQKQEKEILEFYAKQPQTPETIEAMDSSISEVRLDAVWSSYCDIQPDNPQCKLIDKPGDTNAKPP